MWTFSFGRGVYGGVLAVAGERTLGVYHHLTLLTCVCVVSQTLLALVGL